MSLDFPPYHSPAVSRDSREDAMKGSVWAPVLVFCLTAASSSARAFDCAKAYLPVDFVICSDPSRGCRTAQQPLAQVICADRDLALTDLRCAQAHVALLKQLDDTGKRDLKQEDLRFLDAVQQHCGIPLTGSIPLQPDALRKC